MKPLNVAVLGCGVVGSQVVRLLTEQAGDLAARVGAPVELVGVGVRRIDAPRDVEVPEGLLTTDAAGLVARDDVDVVVEVIGGIEPARSLILRALETGASVVTGDLGVSPGTAGGLPQRRPDARGDRVLLLPVRVSERVSRVAPCRCSARCTVRR